MRKLREAIVASQRTDDFALRVYMFVIRTTILLKHIPSYHPALLHLLHRLHPRTSLSAAESNEFVGYHILDLACRQNDLAAAYAIRHQYDYRNHTVESVLRALVHGNWLLFWRLKASMGMRERYLMECADDRIRSIALGALGKAYTKVHLAYLEYATNCSWDDTKEQDKLGWMLEGQIIKPRRTQRS